MKDTRELFQNINDLKTLFLMEVPEQFRKQLPPKIKNKYKEIKRPPYRNPSKYKISALTLVSDLNIYIDIKMRTFYNCIIASILVEWDKHEKKKYNIMSYPGIIDIQYLNHSRGNAAFMEIKNKSKRENTFGNGCTMRICLKNIDDELNIVNVKLFNNGRLHFTGLHGIHEAEECVNIIKERVEFLIKRSQMHCEIHDICKGHKPTYINKKTKCISYTAKRPYQKPNKILQVLQNKKIIKYMITRFTQLDIHILSKSCTFFWKLLDARNHSLWKQLLDAPYSKKHTGLDKFIINELISRKKYVHYTIDKKNNTYIQKNIIKFENLKSVYLKRLNDYKPIILHSHQNNPVPKFANQNIEMVNSNFNTYFCINQRKFTKILEKDYPYMDISYEPADRYHGIKIYWSHPSKKRSDVGQSTAGNVFISIFRTGSVMISGKSQTLLDDGYTFINQLLKKYYEQIWMPNT